jgi:hypothetical protein
MIPKNSVTRCICCVVVLLLCGFMAAPSWAAGAGQLSGIVAYNNTAISAVTNAEPSFWVYDETLSQTVDDFTYTYNNSTGAYALGNLPVGPILVSLTFHLTGSASTLPGNYRTNNFPNLSQLTAEQCANYQLDALYTLHQVRPWDNSGIDFAVAPASPYPVHSGHIVLEWDAVTGADHYEIGITKNRDEEHPLGFGYVETIVTTTTEETFYSIELDDSAEFEHYHSSITAYNAGNVVIAHYATTYTNGYGGDYRFKVLEYEMDLDKVTITAGKTAGTDSFSISGRFDPAVPTGFINGQMIMLQIGDPAFWTIKQALKQSGQKAIYSYTGTPNLKLDLEKGTFKMWAKDVDLTGVAAPVIITLALGSYNGAGLAEDEGQDDVINGKKHMPLQLLIGQEDALRVDKVVCKEETGLVKSLAVQGGLAMADDVDLSQIAGTICWGNQQYPIPLGGLVNKGADKYQYSKKATQGDSSTAVVLIDLAKCTFRIGLKNTAMTWQVSPAVLRLQLGTFDENSSVEF